MVNIEENTKPISTNKCMEHMILSPQNMFFKFHTKN